MSDVLHQYINESEWAQGYNEHIVGRTRSHNPFADKKGSISYQAWDQGWCSAEKERNHNDDIVLERCVCDDAPEGCGSYITQ